MTDATLRATWRAIIASPDPTELTPPLVAGRWQAQAFHANGSCGTSTVWRGVDLETGRDVALKQYWKHPKLYQNEVAVHREMDACSSVTKALAHDDNQLIVVKEFAPGETIDVTCRSEGGRALLRLQARQIVLAMAESIAFAAHAGRAEDHGFNTDNMVVSSATRPVIVDVCNIARRPWQAADACALATVVVRLFDRTEAAKALGDRVCALRPRETNAPEHSIGVGYIVEHLATFDGQMAEALGRHVMEPAALLSSVEALC